MRNSALQSPLSGAALAVAGGGSGSLSLSTTSSTNATGGTISYPIADVWRVLPAVYESFGIPLTHADGSSHVLETKASRPRHVWLFSGEQVRCSSKGVPEQRLVAAIDEELAKK